MTDGQINQMYNDVREVEKYYNSIISGNETLEELKSKIRLRNRLEKVLQIHLIEYNSLELTGTLDYEYVVVLQDILAKYNSMISDLLGVDVRFIKYVVFSKKKVFSTKKYRAYIGNFRHIKDALFQN